MISVDDDDMPALKRAIVSETLCFIKNVICLSQEAEIEIEKELEDIEGDICRHEDKASHDFYMDAEGFRIAVLEAFWYPRFEKIFGPRCIMSIQKFRVARPGEG